MALINRTGERCSKCGGDMARTALGHISACIMCGAEKVERHPDTVIVQAAGTWGTPPPNSTCLSNDELLKLLAETAQICAAAGHKLKQEHDYRLQAASAQLLETCGYLRLIRLSIAQEIEAQVVQEGYSRD